MHILINALHTQTGGGLVYLNSLLPHLVKMEGVRFTLLHHAMHADKFEVPAGMEVKQVAPKGGFLRLHLWEQAVLPILARKWGVDVTLCNANYAPLFAPKPVVVVHNNPAVGAYAQGFKQKLYWHALRFITRLSLLRCAHAFVVAGHVVESYVKSKRVKRKITTAYPACPPGASPLHEAIKHDPNLVVAIGDFYVQKDYPTLIKAFVRLKEEKTSARLVVVGRMVDAAVKQQVDTLIEEHALSESVELKGALPHKDLLTLLAQAGVYINTSLVECFNMPVLEALAMGAPVVTADLPFQREVAGDAAVYVNVSEGGDVPAAFAIAMLGVLANEPIADSLRERGQKQAAAFSWESTAQVIITQLEQLK